MQGHKLAFSRRNSPECCCARSALSSEGAGNTGRLVRPQSHVRRSKVKSTRVSQVTPKTPGIPRAMVYGLLRALPGDRALLPPSPLRSLLLKDLTPASRRQDHTTSPSASGALVRSTLRVHRIPPHVRDDRETPLQRGGTGESILLFLPHRQPKFGNSEITDATQAPRPNHHCDRGNDGPGDGEVQKARGAFASRTTTAFCTRCRPGRRSRPGWLKRCRTSRGARRAVPSS